MMWPSDRKGTSTWRPTAVSLQFPRPAVSNRYMAAGGWGDGGDDGPAADAESGTVSGLAVASDGTVYVVEGSHAKVRRFTRGGIVEIFAGTGLDAGGGDGGPATQAQLNRPAAVAVDKDGNVFIAESSGRVVRKVTRMGR